MRVFDIAALLKVSLSVEELLLTMADSKVWENARESGRLDDKVARSVLTGYLAAVDWPANFWHRELAEIFPHAKVVLTVRDARAWYRSVSTLHKCLLSIYCSWPTSWFHWLAGRGELAANIRHRLTAADLEDSIQALLGENEEEAVQRFLDHTGKISEGIIRLGPISL